MQVQHVIQDYQAEPIKQTDYPAYPDNTSNDDTEERKIEFDVRFESKDEEANVDISMFNPVDKKQLIPGRLGVSTSTAQTFHAFCYDYERHSEVKLSKNGVGYLPSFHHRYAPRFLYVRMEDDSGIQPNEYEHEPPYLVITNLMDSEDLIVQTFTNFREDRTWEGKCIQPYFIMHTNPYYLVGEEFARKQHKDGSLGFGRFPIYPNKNYLFRLIKASYMQDKVDALIEMECFPELILHYQANAKE